MLASMSDVSVCIHKLTHVTAMVTQFFLFTCVVPLCLIFFSFRLTRNILISTSVSFIGTPILVRCAANSILCVTCFLPSFFSLPLILHSAAIFPSSLWSFTAHQCIGVKKFLMREDMARLDVALSNQRK